MHYVLRVRICPVLPEKAEALNNQFQSVVIPTTCIATCIALCQIWGPAHILTEPLVEIFNKSLETSDQGD